MKFNRHLPLLGVVAGIGILMFAASLYPGGTMSSTSTVGYSWTQNFISSLFQARALNGAPNPARFVAMGAMLFICASLGTVFNHVAGTAKSRAHSKTIQIAGIGAAVYALVIASPMHNVGVNVGLAFSLVALLATNYLLFLERRWLLLAWGALCIALTFVSAWMYYGKMLYGALPVVQKVSVASYVGWLLAIYYTRFGTLEKLSGAAA